MNDRPHQGGSYVKDKAGKLSRVEFTRPHGEIETTPQPAAPAEIKGADAAPTAKSKGKD